MSFESILGTVLEELDGAMGAALMGSDGIPIAQVQRATQSRGLLAEDVSTAGIEFGRILEEARKASNSLETGALDEAVFVTTRAVLLFRPVDEDVFLIVALEPTANVGKARYRMRRQLAALRDEL